MKKQNNSTGRVTRRQFIGTAAAGAAAFSMVPLHTRCTGTGQRSAKGLPNSRFGGVQVGAITYSFREIRGVEETLQACIDAGVSSVELMSTGIEQWAGAPEEVRVPRRRRGGPPGGGPPGEMPQGRPPGGRRYLRQPFVSGAYRHPWKSLKNSVKCIMMPALTFTLLNFHLPDGRMKKRIMHLKLLK